MTLGSFSSEDEDKNVVIGYISVVIAVLFFGSNWVVTKKFPSGDGFYFQWCMCIGIVIVGIITMLISGCIEDGPIYIEPFAMLGGFLWCTGNLLCVPCLHMIGLTLGPGIWGVANMVVGWITGTFGLFGTNADKDIINIFWLNCVGAVLAALSVPFYSLIKTTVKGKEKKSSEKEKKSSTSSDGTELQNPEPKPEEKPEEDKKEEEEDKPVEDKPTEDPTEEAKQEEEEQKKEEESPILAGIKKLPVIVQRIVGLLLAIIAGALFGSSFDPSKYLQDTGKSSPDGIDYVLSHFLGIFFASTFYFICYTICFQNKPFVFKETTLPAMVSGMMWGVAQVAWFIANSNIPYVVSYPLITSGPGLLSALWGIVVFREVRGWKNFLFFGIGTIVLFAGIICIVVSR